MVHIYISTGHAVGMCCTTNMEFFLSKIWDCLTPTLVYILCDYWGKRYIILSPYDEMTSHALHQVYMNHSMVGNDSCQNYMKHYLVIRQNLLLSALCLNPWSSVTYCQKMLGTSYPTRLHLKRVGFFLNFVITNVYYQCATSLTLQLYPGQVRNTHSLFKLFKPTSPSIHILRANSNMR